MERIFCVKIIHPKNDVWKNLWAFALKSEAETKAAEMNAKGFKDVTYQVEEVKFKDEDISEDDF